MDQQTNKRVGAFSWNELMTNDVAGAKAFYSEMFGWQMHDSPTPEGMYTVLNNGGHNMGGIMAAPAYANSTPPAWCSYISVDNVDQQTKRAEQLGGKVILAPMDIPNVGRYAVINDPQGAILALITFDENYQG